MINEEFKLKNTADFNVAAISRLPREYIRLDKGPDGSDELTLMIGNTRVVRLSTLLDFLLLICLWLFAAMHFDTNDFTGYKKMYEFMVPTYTSPKQFDYEIGFYYLIKLGLFFGVSFEFYRAAFLFICMFMQFIAVRKIGAAYWKYAILYVFYPYLLDPIQLRNYMAISFVMLAISFMVKRNRSRGDLIAAFVLLLCAIPFHYAITPYLIFMLLLIRNKKLYNLLAGTVTLGYIAGCFLIFNFNKPMAEFLGKFRGALRRYILNGFAFDWNAWAKYMLVYIIMLVIVLVWFKLNDEIKADIDQIKRVLILNFALINFTLLNDNFNRFFRVSVMLLCICMAMKSGKKKTGLKVTVSSGMDAGMNYGVSVNSGLLQDRRYGLYKLFCIAAFVLCILALCWLFIHTARVDEMWLRNIDINLFENPLSYSDLMKVEDKIKFK